MNTSLPEDNGLIRDDSTADGSESWICSDNDACNQGYLDKWLLPRKE